MTGPIRHGPVLKATGRKPERCSSDDANRKRRRCRWKARSAPTAALTTPRRFPIAKPQAVCVNRDGHLLVSSGSSVLRIRQWGKEPEIWGHFDAPVTALAASEGGRVAVGLSGGALAVRGAAGEPLAGWTPASGPRAVADCLFLSEDELAVVDHGYGPDEPLLSLAPWDDGRARTGPRASAEPARRGSSRPGFIARWASRGGPTARWC